MGAHRWEAAGLGKGKHRAWGGLSTGLRARSSSTVVLTPGGSGGLVAASQLQGSCLERLNMMFTYLLNGGTGAGQEGPWLINLPECASAGTGV